MIILLVILAIVALVAITATVRELIMDGYGRVPTRTEVIERH